ncbi:hypothetical protein BKA81DRAFT_376237 [Phyllosticta paracitricarpa]
MKPTKRPRATPQRRARQICRAVVPSQVCDKEPRRCHHHRLLYDDRPRPSHLVGAAAEGGWMFAPGYDTIRYATLPQCPVCESACAVSGRVVKSRQPRVGLHDDAQKPSSQQASQPASPPSPPREKPSFQPAHLSCVYCTVHARAPQIHRIACRGADTDKFAQRASKPTCRRRRLDPQPLLAPLFSQRQTEAQKRYGEQSETGPALLQRSWVCLPTYLTCLSGQGIVSLSIRNADSSSSGGAAAALAVFVRRDEWRTAAGGGA